MGGASSVSHSPVSPAVKVSPSQVNKREEAQFKEDSQFSEYSSVPSHGSDHTLVKNFSFRSYKIKGSDKAVGFDKSLDIEDLEKDVGHGPADDSNCSTHLGTTSTNVLSPNPSVGNFLSVGNSEDELDDSKAFDIVASIKEISEQLATEKSARELFGRFVKDNSAKWIEQIATQAQFKWNLSNPNKVLSTPSSPNAASPKSDNRVSQYFSPVTVNFHSFTVTKAMLYQQNQPLTWSFDVSSKKFPALEDDENNERLRLDIINLMKQMKIKDSIEANSIYANSRSFDSYDTSTVIGTVDSAKTNCTVGKSSLYLERIFSREALEAYLYAVLLPLFAQTSQYQTLKAKEWSVDVLNHLSYTSGTNQVNAGNYIQDFRITSMIQQTRTHQKNEALANIQQLFYTISKELSLDRMEETLSTPKWLDIIPSSLTECPIGVVYCRNEVSNASHNDSSSGFLKESLPIVFSNQAMTKMTGYARQELTGRNLSMLIPKKDMKSLQFPHPPSHQQQQQSHEFYNEKRLLQKYLDYNQKGEGRYKVGLIKEKKNQEKFYDFISSIPIYQSSPRHYQYLLSLHYNINDESAKVSDFKIMEDLQLLLFLLSY